ncbi:UBN2_3 domain-containing protein [Cucumis melo var. makuwa]|uniref:UBN2_3 domain-containing protein n=1 Tax=Cucumis melo var. makuwa TaxID=1194695 RepID=A0A5A7TQ60_CUCMM|nr:UBN2_3 domain-containing protein [Cucumis melo var. makuwa]
MDWCREIVWDTPNDTQYAKLKEPDHIYDFLVGLNPKFDTVCGRILIKRPIPSLMEVCFKVCLEEDYSNVMSVLTIPTICSAAFIAQSSNHDSEKNNGKPIPVCEHCKKQWHTKDQYWKLYGRPLRGVIAQSGMPQSLGLISVDGKNPWILDLGATNHLLSSLEHFISYALCVGNEKTRIVDDFLVPITSKGQIVPFDDFAL